MDRLEAAKKSQKKMVRITMEVKKEIVEKYEGGMRIRDLAATFRMPRTTICTIVKKRDAIKSANVAMGVKSITKQRSDTLELVERLLLIWITEKQCAGENLTESMICEKAKLLHAELLKGKQETEVFKASHGWFSNFKRRTGIQGVVKPADQDVDGDFVSEFRAFACTEDFLPQQVFNCDETTLFWKRMPENTYITQEEKALPNHKSMKDKLTLLLCSNASGDCKIKPLLIYHSENPRAFQKHKVIKARLPVVWKSNNKARLTTEYFIHWLTVVFSPSVKRYLEEKKMPLKALLVMDKAPCHPPILRNFDFITIKFLPPDVTLFIQPMTQGIVSNFKKLYIKALFQKCIDNSFERDLTLREYWKDHFNIFHCISLIDKAWKEVSSSTINSGWRNLWPEALNSEHVKFKNQSNTESDIVRLAKSMGLNITETDIDDLLEEHREELTTQWLQELEMENKPAKKLAASNKDTKEPSTGQIEDILAKWMEVKDFAEKYHPNKTQTTTNGIVWNNQTMSYFRAVLKRQQKEVPGQAGPSGEKKPKAEHSSEYITPEVGLQEDFSIFSSIKEEET